MEVYKLTNSANGKIYIGQTVYTSKDRFRTHRNAANRGVNTVICKAIRKYGIDTFSMEILKKCKDINELNMQEEFWIKELNSMIPNGYNMIEGGNNRRFSDLAKKKLSEAHMGQFISRETRAKLSKIHKGRKKSPEHIVNASNAHMKPVICLNTGEKFRGIKEAAKKLKICRHQISAVLTNPDRHKSVKGYKFARAE